MGQLGNGETVNSNLPVQVKKSQNDYLTDIIQISSGNSHTVALGKDGSVYTWGKNDIGQLGLGTSDNSNFARKVDGLKNIKKVFAYKNITLALDQDGKVFGWGEGYSTLPMRLISSKKFIDVAGQILLSTDGMIYDIKDLENPIEYLSRIAKISAGDEHWLALSTNGYVYSFGKNYYRRNLKESIFYWTYKSYNYKCSRHICRKEYIYCKT